MPMKEISNSILSLPRYSKRAIAIITDVALCVVCTWLAFVIRLEELILFRDFNFYSAFISISLAVPIFWLCGLYRTIFRFAGLSIIFTVVTSIFLYGLLYFSIIGVFGINGVPRTIGILQPMILFFAIIGSRFVVKYFLTGFKNYSNKKNILVYGAGEAGQQLVIALENSPKFKVSGFIDDNKQLQRQVISGKTVYPLSKLEKLIKIKDISFVFLAMPSIARSKRNEIIENINKYKINVKTLPSISEFVDGRVRISDIKDFNIDDLLSRKEVQPDYYLLNKNISFKTIVVTGAGGSIGSELSRQIFRLNPNKLVLIELNEFALYAIHEELKNLNKNIRLIPLLVNAQDQSKLEKIFELFKVDTVYHCAAYKHVSLVEENICEGVKNNVYSTLAVANASIIKKVSTFVLISSDKAVRPTNMMGATKRLSELCIQGIHDQNKESSTNFSIVRFGNVLASSGSVIPKFTKQIKDGGPVTLTHENVTRFFMTITEAAQLVIQAGAMGKYSEVFVLDMGESVKIKDIIIKMIKLSGLSLRDSNNNNGDLEIKITGLKPGEKLYEELLIGTNPEKTNHPKIYKTNDPYIPFIKLKDVLKKLKTLLNNNDSYEVKKLLLKFLNSYRSNAQMVDHLYSQQLILDSENNKNILPIRNEDDKVVNIR